MKTSMQFPQRNHKNDHLPFPFEESKSRLLPHIIGEYEFRITNKLLIQKIINPRRDKIIMDSLVNAVQKGGNGGVRSSSTSKSIYNRRKKNQKKKVSHECVSAIVTPSRQNSSFQIQTHHQGEDKVGLEEKAKIEREKQDGNIERFVGRIKRNNITQSAFFKDNYMIQNLVKSGTIVHQSCRNSYSQVKIDNDQRYLKKVRQRQYGRATHKQNRTPVEPLDHYQINRTTAMEQTY